MIYARMLKDYVAARFVRVSDDEGQGMVEYALIIGVISIILIAAFLTTGIEGAITGLANEIISGVNAGVGSFT